MNKCSYLIQLFNFLYTVLHITQVNTHARSSATWSLYYGCSIIGIDYAWLAMCDPMVQDSSFATVAN